MQKVALSKELGATTYPGRGIVIGRSPFALAYCAAYEFSVVYIVTEITGFPLPIQKYPVSKQLFPMLLTLAGIVIFFKFLQP